MGTNFYWRTDRSLLPTGEAVPIERDSPVVHIGKRSAAGRYCWDCDETLYMGGKERLHYGEYGWFDACPKCGKTAQSGAGLARGPAAVELGFADPETERPTGVSGAASFSWAQEPERVGALAEARADEQIIEDEYGRLLTGREFLTMLRANCPIQYTDSVGREFS